MRISDWSSDVCSSDLQFATTCSNSTPGSLATHSPARQKQRWPAMVNKNSVATGKNFDLSVSEGCSTTSLQPFRNESIFKCSDAYLAAAVEYHSRFGEKRDFDELIGEGQKIWRGAADYQTRSQEFRCEIKIGRASCRERRCKYV